MYIARILYPVKVLGPGNRIGIWFAGCKHHCKGCSNPELWDFSDRYKTSVKVILELISRIAAEHKVDGFTLTGGDPFEQPEALRELLPMLKTYTEDILVYTGYDYATISSKYSDIVADTAVIIDGRYIEEQNNATPMKGSDNQNIIILNKSLENIYKEYLCGLTNEIQNFNMQDGVVSVGIHRPGYEKELDSILLEKGLV